MNRLFLNWRPRMVWAVLLLAPVLALAQSPHEGIYLGTFQGPYDDGEFALIVNDRGYGTLAAYDSLNDEGYLEHNIFVRADGRFEFVTLRGVRINGQATASGVSGGYFTTDTQGSFAGRRAPVDGPLQGAAGYYSGPVSITSTGPDTDLFINNRLVAIVAADGSTFFMLDHGFPWPADFWPGGFDLGPGFGTNSAFHIGSGFDSMFHLGSGNCGPFPFGGGFGWPFNLSLDFSIHVSFLGSVDLNFSINQAACNSPWQWNYFPRPIENSGGIVQIQPDGVIQGTLLDGVALQGQLDALTGSAEGTLSQRQDAITWSGHWVMERHDRSSIRAAKQYNHLPDIDGDGQADILWRHAATDADIVWLMDGADILTELPLEIPSDPQWTLILVNQLNDDQQADLVWLHPLNGELFVWLSGDTAPVRFAIDPAWQMVGSGDFDGDAQPEILVTHNGTSTNALITDLLGQAALTPFPATEDPSWSPVAVADFDGDSNADLLWANQHTPDLLIWLMNGQMLAQELYLTAEQSSQYELAGLGDFDGDQSMDILWRDNVTGIPMVTLRPAVNGAVDVELGENVSLEWQLAAVGDMNNDGTDDLIWRNNLTGQNTVWRVADTQVAGTVSLMPVADLHWTIRP